MQCRSHAAQLGKSYRELQAANFEVLLILGDSIDKARHYVASLHLPFPVLADPDRIVYHQYGLGKVMFIQRTASVIIDCNGIIQYIKTTTNPLIWLQEYKEIQEFVSSMPDRC